MKYNVDMLETCISIRSTNLIAMDECELPGGQLQKTCDLCQFNPVVK